MATQESAESLLVNLILTPDCRQQSLVEWRFSQDPEGTETTLVLVVESAVAAGETDRDAVLSGVGKPEDLNSWALLEMLDELWQLGRLVDQTGRNLEGQR